MSAFYFKLIAIIAMFIQHMYLVCSSNRTFSYPLLLYMIGGITYPVMSLMAFEGYQYTKNFKSYCFRMLLCGIVSQIPFYLAFSLKYIFNIYFNILIGLYLLYTCDHKEGFKQYAMIFLLFVLSFFTDWSGLGFALYFMQTLNKDRKVFLKHYIIFFLFVSASFLLLGEKNLGLFFIMSAFSSFLLRQFYNGKRGLALKYAFYLFYPLHLIFLILIKKFCLT